MNLQQRISFIKAKIKDYQKLLLTAKDSKTINDVITMYEHELEELHPGNLKSWLANGIMELPS